MELRPGYKKTDVGEIPEDWQCRPLEDFTSFISYGFTNPMPTTLSGPFMVTAADISGGRIILQNARHTSVAAYEKLLTAKSKPRKNDVLLTKDGALGRVALVGEETICINQSVAVLRPNPLIHPPFFSFLLQADNYQRRMLEDAGGTTIKHIYITIVNKMPIGLPVELREQKAIAEVLSDVDASISALSRLISKNRNLRRGVMQRLLTGRTRLPGFSTPWQTKTLGEIGEVSGAGVDKKSRSGEISVRLVNYMDVYRSDAVHSSMLSHFVTAKETQARRCSILSGDVFFTPTSETRNDIAHSAVAVEDIPDAVYSYHLVRLRLNEPWDIRFRAYAFKTKDFMDQARIASEGSGTRYVITLPKFRALTIRYPRDPEEQSAIARVLLDIETEIYILETRLEKTQALKQAMMQALLTGRMRLPISREAAPQAKEAAHV